jgi:hypothetical protein
MMEVASPFNHPLLFSFSSFILLAFLQLRRQFKNRKQVMSLMQ